MKYIRSIFLLLTLLNFVTVQGQENNIKGAISTVDSASLTILNLYPDSFPNVSVVFKAETKDGKPIWDLTKERMKATENDYECEVVSLEQVSKNRPINLGVVIDHSGSMEWDESQFYDSKGKPLFSYTANWDIIYPKGYVPPIESAKSAIKEFIKSFNFQKDYISVIGFSTRVDKRLPLTQNVTEINSIVDEMKADSATALYDAIIAGIEEMVDHEGVNVLVALTDGHDNSSISKWSDVIEKANAHEIPIYMVGLGNVNADTLRVIADSTKGKFYHVKSSKSLGEIYTQISMQVQAFYDLIYRSENFSSSDTIRNVRLSFDLDNSHNVADSLGFDLPYEVVTYLKQKEEEIKREKEYRLYGGTVGIITLIAAGTLLLHFRRRKKNKLLIKKLYPNPSNGEINLEYDGLSGLLQIYNYNGQIEKIIPLTAGKKQFDLSDLPDGNYIARIQSDRGRSNSIKFKIQK